MRWYRQCVLAVCVCFIMLINTRCSGTNHTEETTPLPKNTSTNQVDQNTNEPENNTDGLIRSKLTGEIVSQEVLERRPYAIMLNNIKIASPQSGTSEASILYECLVEGGITRLMGIFEDFDSDRIGSTRSARHYFVSIADEYDAIYVHYGQTDWAIDKMKELGVDHLSGLSKEGATVFYRDSSIKAPHNAFASYDGIWKATNDLGYRTKYREDVTPHYGFYPEDTDFVDGITARKITLGFSNYQQPYFVYKEEQKQYGRYQFGVKHVDASTGEQLYFKNIIIQLVEESNLDKNGYQTMDIENDEGKGYYISNGKAKSIRWKKNEKDSSCQYFDESGGALVVNTGKTYIALYPTSREKHFIIE